MNDVLPEDRKDGRCSDATSRCKCLKNGEYCERYRQMVKLPAAGARTRQIELCKLHCKE
jgi:hypothetical protein